MKTIITLALCFLGVTMIHAQTNVAQSRGVEALRVSKTNGIYEFVLPESVSEDDVQKNSKYYELYFTPVFNSNSHVVKIELKDDSDKARYTVARFLSACGVQEVLVDGKNYTISQFIETYLK